MRRFILTVLFVFTGGISFAEDIPRFPAEWFVRPPTAENVKAVLAAASAQGWSPVAAGIYMDAINAFEHGHTDVAEAWYYVAAWTDLLGHTQAQAGRTWLEAVNRAGLLNAKVNQAAIGALPEEPLVRLVSFDTVTWLIGDRAFSAAFFDQLSPYDYLPQVLTILRELHDANAARFATYNQLALAIALVYDTPPPDVWPHAQVTVTALPRALPQPLQAFNFFTDSDARGATLQKLSALSAAELKFTVDIAATFNELTWAQKSIKIGLPQLAKCYDLIRYRDDRLKALQFIWPGDSYGLPLIYQEGGICVDQAYFASQAGKAKGVPTLLFSGEGRDGRHAWFGYLGANQHWVLDAGRYAEQRFVTGVAIDPQTWGELSDHDLQFLSEGFYKLPPYRQSRQYEIFAKLYLELGAKPQALAAARKAVNYERRNLVAWETLIAASADTGVRNREALLQEAALAFQRYPDLNARFVRAFANSLRSRGEASAADAAERSIARKNQGARNDLSIDQAAAMVSQVLENTPLPEQLAAYKKALALYGKGGGIDFYDRVVVPFVKALASQEHHGDAKLALFNARATLKPEADSQLDNEMKELAESLR